MTKATSEEKDLFEYISLGLLLGTAGAVAICFVIFIIGNFMVFLDNVL